MKDSGKKSLPPDWQWVLVDDAVSLEIDLFDKQTFPKTDFTYIDITSVDNTAKRVVSPKTLLTKTAPSRATYIVHTGDILIATVRPNLNAVARIEPVHDGAVCSSGFCVLRFKEGFCVDYFFHFFLSPQFVSAVTALVQGAMYPAIGDDDVRAFRVPAPVAFEEQEKIAAMLETKWKTFQTMRAATERQVKAISALPSAILRKFFTKLPKEWRFVSLADKELVQIVMGQSPPGHTYNKAGKGLPFFQGSKDFGTLYPETRIWCSQPKKNAEPNDVLLSVRAPVGPTNLAKEKCCIGRGIAALRCKTGLSFKYLLMILRHFEKEIVGAGSIFSAIGGDEIKRITFPIPSTVEEQNAIADEIKTNLNHFEQLCAAAERQLEAISALPATTLREFFNFGSNAGA